MFCTRRCYENCHQKDYHVVQLRHLLNMPKAACTESGKDKKPAHINTAGHAYVWFRFVSFSKAKI